MEKRGISNIISVAIIILVAIALIAVVWFSIRGGIIRIGESIEPEYIVLSADYSIMSASSDGEEAPVKVIVKKTSADKTFPTVVMIDSQGDTHSKSYTEEEVGIFQTVEFSFDWEDDLIAHGVNDLVKIEVYASLGNDKGDIVNSRAPKDFLITFEQPTSGEGSCGDETIGAGEVCDGSNLDGKSCASFPTYNSGTLDCTDSCGFDFSGCSYVPPPVCGNGVPETGEECDDLDDDNNDDCLNNCQNAECGDGYIWTGNEECDDGDTDNGDGCDSSCEVEQYWECSGEPSNCDAICGDGHTVAGEEACDDGINNGCAGYPGCNSDCSGLLQCGNNNVDCNEECDGSNLPNNLCTATCTETFCGDNIIQKPNGRGIGGPANNGMEDCDGNNLGGNTCGLLGFVSGGLSCSSCAFNTANCIGNSAIECQDGIDNDNDGATDLNDFSCLNAVDDDETNPKAQCQDGIDNDIDGTTDLNDISCNNKQDNDESACNNGVIELGETCDSNSIVCTTNGGYPGTKQCNNQCNGWGSCISTLSCGDGTLTIPPEQCDGTNLNGKTCSDFPQYNSGTLSCSSSNCQFVFTQCTTQTVCGNNNLEPGEVCDDGNTNDCDPYPGCSAQCNRLQFCGNGGSPECGEQCDDGNGDNRDNCKNNCQLAFCGDGVCGWNRSPPENSNSCPLDCPPNPTCFVKGSLVNTLFGERRIELLKEGDFVFGYDEKSDKKVLTRVDKVFVHETWSYLVINERLKVTREHPMLINGVWSEIGKAKLGDFVKTENGEERITSVEEVFEEETVYTLDVGHPDTFIVEGYVVHNKAPGEQILPGDKFFFPGGGGLPGGQE